uniref:Uncharacterized protein n=1 Tax=Timema bartmani TaxID=61472 RepID=A0A7R9F2W8_9NEOP|nr:unnamed protein product [Timema bartmani]
MANQAVCLLLIVQRMRYQMRICTDLRWLSLRFDWHTLAKHLGQGRQIRDELNFSRTARADEAETPTTRHLSHTTLQHHTKRHRHFSSTSLTLVWYPRPQHSSLQPSRPKLVRLHRRPRVPMIPSLYTKSVLLGCLRSRLTALSFLMRRLFFSTTLTWDAPSNLAASESPTCLNWGNLRQHTLTLHEPDIPWHLHTRCMRDLMDWRTHTCRGPLHRSNTDRLTRRPASLLCRFMRPSPVSRLSLTSTNSRLNFSPKWMSCKHHDDTAPIDDPLYQGFSNCKAQGSSSDTHWLPAPRRTLTSCCRMWCSSIDSCGTGTGTRLSPSSPRAPLTANMGITFSHTRSRIIIFFLSQQLEGWFEVISIHAELRMHSDLQLMSYSSPMASLVLTDSSQLTSDSQHLVMVASMMSHPDDQSHPSLQNNRKKLKSIKTKEATSTINKATLKSKQTTSARKQATLIENQATSKKKQLTSTRQITLKTKQDTSKTKEDTPKIKQVTSKTKQVTSKTKQATSKTKQATSKTKQVTSKTKQVTSKTKQAISKTKQVTSKTKQVTSKTKQAALMTNKQTQKLSKETQQVELRRSPRLAALKLKKI